MRRACCRQLLPTTAVVFFVLSRGAEAKEPHERSKPESAAAVITVHSPAELGGKPGWGYFATFSAALEPGKEYRTWTPPSDNAQGCSPYTFSQDPSLAGVVVVVRRLKCSFDVKASLAYKAGARGVIVVWDDDKVSVMSGNQTTESADDTKIFSISVTRSFGDLLIARTPAVLSFEYYIPGFDLSEAFVPVLATVLVVLGAYFSTSDLRVGSPLAPRQEEVLEIGYEIAVGWCVMGSVMLVVLYFFMQYMIYVIMACFCLGGAGCITQFGSSCLVYNFPPLKQQACVVPMLGPVSRADAIALVPALLLVGGWLEFHNESFGWIFQDIVGAGFLCMLQRTLRLPNLWVASALLIAMFFFDIFWVFLSPLIFEKSVMVQVAKGGGTGQTIPMLLRIPAFSDPLGRDRMLGFGDVALPGLLISFLLRYDTLSNKRARLCSGYFVPAVIGYFIGLCVTIVALLIMTIGQPALLYLVPGTLGTTLVLAWRRGELSQLWSGNPICQTGNGDSLFEAGAVVEAQ